MTHKQLHEFASTPEKGLPEHVHKKKSDYSHAREARRG
jgi:hypothetical protein